MWFAGLLGDLHPHTAVVCVAKKPKTLTLAELQKRSQELGTDLFEFLDDLEESTPAVRMDCQVTARQLADTLTNAQKVTLPDALESIVKLPCTTS